jgi:uncharacterized protein YjiS (DUF1127 family)
MTAIAAAPRLRRRGYAIWAWLHLCWQRRRQRRVLSELNDYLLDDLGLTADQVREEARRPPWR